MDIYSNVCSCYCDLVQDEAVDHIVTVMATGSFMLCQFVIRPIGQAYSRDFVEFVPVIHINLTNLLLINRGTAFNRSAPVQAVTGVWFGYAYWLQHECFWYAPASPAV